MRILVTGGAGYIGSVLVPFLLSAPRQKYNVTVVDSFIHGENSLAQCCAEPHFTPIRGDCRDFDLMRPLLAKADLVLPLAAIVGAPACERDHTAATTTNQMAVNAICAHLSASQRIILPNTNSAYGVSKPGAFCTEESPVNPLSLYARTKMAAETIVLDRENSIALRLATVFGASPRMRLDLLVNDLTYRAVTDRAVGLFEPDARRNFLHVRDACDAFLHAIEHFDAMRGNVFNVGDTHANMTKAELCGRIAALVPGFRWYNLDGADPDKRDYLVSNAKIERTGWLPGYALDDGIQELVKLYQGLQPMRYGNL